MKLQKKKSVVGLQRLHLFLQFLASNNCLFLQPLMKSLWAPHAGRWQTGQQLGDFINGLLDGSEAGLFITLSFVHASLLHSLYYGVTGLL